MLFVVASLIGRNRDLGAVIKTENQPGHLRFQCLDSCLMNVKLSEIKEVCFPGAFSSEPVGTIWKAWVASSIFSRSDLDLATKIRYYRQGAICLDEAALKPILKLAYEKCTAWTEFVCTTEKIKEHEKIEKFAVESMYEVAFQALKRELAEDEKANRLAKEGPTGFTAPEWAAVLEKDDIKGGVDTTVVRTFKDIWEKLNERPTYGMWVITWSIDNKKWSPDIIKEICASCAKHKERGKIVTAWTPRIEANESVWREMIGVGRTVDQTLANGAARNQFYPTSNTVRINGKLYAEINSPESCIHFYGKYAGVGNARYLYATIRHRVPSLQLNSMYAPPRTPLTRRRGMWHDGDHAAPPKRPSLRSLDHINGACGHLRAVLSSISPSSKQ
ncbi:hypothetical protein OESDEN_01855 [Oesophagostomum dentatum]|uniref:Uncharacterized protein n=1 Tax=Oesophagostomum dentatum TaxID=61180 RepID=A0A0B1TQ17_OESDE|nr:hypothetical protein OESDEN_01855 [Oesophagostomum dentatum]